MESYVTKDNYMLTGTSENILEHAHSRSQYTTVPHTQRKGERKAPSEKTHGPGTDRKVSFGKRVKQISINFQDYPKFICT